MGCGSECSDGEKPHQSCSVEDTAGCGLSEYSRDAGGGRTGGAEQCELNTAWRGPRKVLPA